MYAMRYRAKEPHALVIFAHGAGAGSRHPWMVHFAKGLAARGFDVRTFDFPYMKRGKRLPDRAPVLEAFFADLVKKEKTDLPIVLAGKSMGGRIASQIVAKEMVPRARALVFFGYPLHPPDQPEKRRDAHLPSVVIPMLFVQGSRDEFGDEREIVPLAESLHADLHLVEGGDHSLGVRKNDQEASDTRVLDRVAAFIRGAIALKRA